MIHLYLLLSAYHIFLEHTVLLYTFRTIGKKNPFYNLVGYILIIYISLRILNWISK